MEWHLCNIILKLHGVTIFQNFLFVYISSLQRIFPTYLSSMSTLSVYFCSIKCTYLFFLSSLVSMISGGNNKNLHHQYFHQYNMEFFKHALIDLLLKDIISFREDTCEKNSTKGRKIEWRKINKQANRDRKIQ